MKKIIFMFVTVFLVAGTATFAQENEFNRTANIFAGFMWNFTYTPPTFTGYGYADGLSQSQNNYSSADEDSGWSGGPALAVIGREYLLPIGSNLKLGYSFLMRMSFLSEMDWESPEGSVKKLTNDNAYILDLGAMLGASLQGSISGPVGFVLDLGIAANWRSAEFPKAYWSLLYGYFDLEYTIFDLGLGLNGGIQVDIGEVILETGVNMGLSFFRDNSWNIHQRDNSLNMNTRTSDRSSEGATIFRISPYISIGMRF